MTKDLKQGLALGVAFAALVSAVPSKAQDILDEELCDKAVAYSVKYIPEEDELDLLHQLKGISHKQAEKWEHNFNDEVP